MSTGVFSAAAPTKKPVIAAMSSPPTLQSTSIGSDLSGFRLSSPSRITRIFVCKPALVSPAPRPVTVSTESESKAHTTAVLVVVLPMPISPVAKSENPFCTSVFAKKAPRKKVWQASSRVIASSLRKSAVPRRTQIQFIFLCVTARNNPASTGKTVARAIFAIVQTLVLPVHIFSATIADTSCPVCETPSATIPLSAQKTATAFREISGITRPSAAAMLLTAFSNSPSPLSGCATESQRCSESDFIFLSLADTDAIMDLIFCS